MTAQNYSQPMNTNPTIENQGSAVSVGSDRLLADLKRARSRLYRMELHARKHRGNNTTYCEGKCEGESIGLRFALREIDKILESANSKQ